MNFRRIPTWSAYGTWFLIVTGIAAVLTVRFLVRSGEEVVVPELVGKTVSEAGDLLAQQNLVTEISSSQFSNVVARGRVLTQSIAAGERVRSGRTLTLTLSKGPREQSAVRVTGLDEEAASQILRSSRLRPNVVARTCSDRFAPSIVIAQDPRPGALVHTSEVSLLVSSGSCSDRFVLSNVVGRPLDEALQALDGNNFVLRSVRYEPSDRYPERTILKTEPPAGTVVRPIDLITLTVAKTSAMEGKPAREPRGRLVYLSIRTPVGLVGREAQVWVDREPILASYEIDFLLRPGQNSELALWFPPGGAAVLTIDGEQIWKRNY